MKKDVAVFCLLVVSSFGLSALAARFPLEWNVTYDTKVPYEVEIQPAKLVKSGLMNKGDGFQVFADGRKLGVKTFSGRMEGSVRLHFTVPAGTKKLECACEKLDGQSGGEWTPPFTFGNWSVPKGVTAEKTAAGWLFKGSDYRNAAFVSCSAAVDPTHAGKDVVQEIVLASRKALIRGCTVRIDQYDAAGKRLPESLADHRCTGHMLPGDKVVRYMDEGRIHPLARKLTAVVELRPLDSSYDDYGRKITDRTALLPAIEVMKVDVRVARQLPFPKWNDEFFTAGVSGREGDYALVSGGKNEVGFFHQATTRAGWTQAYQFRDEQDRALPSGDGTIEAWVKPEWSKIDARFTGKPVPLFQCWQGIRTRMLKKNGYGEMLGLHYSPKTKGLSFSIRDWEGHQYKGDAKNVEMPEGAWTHLAVTWKCRDRAKVFVNGKKILETAIPEFKPVPLKGREQDEVNDLWAQQLFVGCTYRDARDVDGFGNESSPFLAGAIDDVRTSTGVRYAADFTPSKDFTVDADTRSLFKFDREFNGVGGAGFGEVKASIHARTDRVEHQLAGTWYFPKDLLPENDPAKVLNILNYPDMPTTADYTSARRNVTRSYDVKAGDRLKVDTPEKVYMDYVEFVNLSKTEPLMYPIVVRKGELDPRSFGDLADSLGECAPTDREKANRVFQYAISASDYFMSHQADFAPGVNVPRPATGVAMVMLNSYCGFECGPLNNLAANMLATVSKCPTSPTGGYGHAFQQVFFDGKNHIYDLSAQCFFPSWDNETSVYLGEDADQPAVHNRVGRSCSHFIRMGSRSFYVGNPNYQEKVAMVLNPGEKFRVCRANNGQFNNLKKWHATGNYYPLKEIQTGKDQYQYDYAEAAGVEPGYKWVLRFDRVFPEISTGVLSFDGKPEKKNPAFCEVKDSSFCYRVRSCYPVVFGVYAAQLANGKFADLEISYDFGKTFKPLPMKDGQSTLQYRVKARHDYLIRVKAPIASVKRLYAKTDCEVNPRTYPGWLKGGGDDVQFKAESATPARITFGWRENAKEIRVKGGLYWGTIPGQERQLVVIKRGDKAEFQLEGVGDSAKARTYGPVIAGIRGNRLRIAADDTKGALIPRGIDLPGEWSKATSFGEVEIVDGDAVKRLVVLVSDGDARLLTPADATLGGAAAVRTADAESVQDRIFMTKGGDTAVFKCDLPAGTYAILPLVRYSGHAKGDPVIWLDDPETGKRQRAAVYINGALDYLKANYSHPGERARWKWDSPTRSDLMQDHNGFVYRLFECTKPTKELKFSLGGSSKCGVELAGVLVVPDPDLELRLDMHKILSGLNCDPAISR